jgi:alcohol dehydrogenase
MLWTYRNPVAVSLGAGALDALPAVSARRPYVLVTYPEPAFAALAERVSRLLGPPQLVVADVRANPDRADLGVQVRRMVALTRAPELVIALGGGSVIDTAKVLAAASRGFAVVDALLERGVAPPDWQPLPLVAVPTTAGTGSEVTCWATVWDRAAGCKRSLDHPLLYPEAALIDPELMLGKPRRLTVSTGLDALSHALESLWNHRVNPVSAAQAVAAAETILDVLPALVRRPDDLGLRTRMAEAAVLAGLAFSNTRTSIAHALSYPVTLEQGTDHGLACSFTLPKVLASLSDVGGLTGEALRRIFGTDLRAGAERLADMLHGLGVSTDPADYGITRLRWEAMVAEATTGARGRNFNGDPGRLVRPEW